MNATRTILLTLCLALSGNSLLKSEFGAVYDHFHENPLEFTESDLHLLADAYYIKSHFSHAQQADLLTSIQTNIGNATNQTGEIGKLIDSTSSLIKVVKDTINTVSNPGSMISNAFSGGVKSLFGRRLADQAGGVSQVVSSLENKVTEAKTHQQSITNALSTSQKLLGAIQGIGQLLSGNSSGFMSKIGSLFGGKRMLGSGDYSGETHEDAKRNLIAELSNLFQNAGAHLEHLADKPDESRGRHRKSLYQLRAEKDRLLRMSISAKETARYLNGVDEQTIDFGRIENHLWDLVQDGGAGGKAYLRGVQTLKCILLHQGCPQAQVIAAPSNAQIVYLGQNANQGVNAGSSSTGNVIVQTGTSALVQSGPLNLGNNQVAGVAQQANIQPGLLTGQSWNLDSVSQSSNAFNPSQGNEAVIVQNESQVSQMPPVSDLVSGTQYATVLNQVNSGVVAPQVSTFNVVTPSQGGQATTVTTISNNAAIPDFNESDFDKIQTAGNAAGVIVQPVRRNLNEQKSISERDLSSTKNMEVQ